MTVFTYSFYYLSIQGWSYLFGKWWVSLLWTILFTLIDFFLITGENKLEVNEIWLRRFPIGLLGWLVGSILSEYIVKVKPIMLDTGIYYHFYPAGILLQGIIYWISLAFISLDFSLPNIIIIMIVHIIYLWIMCNASMFSGRFKSKKYRLSYYRYWAFILYFSEILYLISIIWLPENINNLLHLWTSLGIGLICLIICIILGIFVKKK